MQRNRTAAGDGIVSMQENASWRDFRICIITEIRRCQKPFLCSVKNTRTSVKEEMKQEWTVYDNI